MLKYVKIIDGEDTNHHEGEIVKRKTIEEENKNLHTDNTKATFKPTIRSTKNISYNADGFLSAASFEKTFAALAQAEVEERID